MNWIMLKSKLHQARVTDAQLDYEGSLTIDRELMDAVNLRPHEKILVANLENGERFETYAIPDAPGTRTICLNGATAHKGKRGDRVIVFSFGVVSPEELDTHKALVLRLDAANNPIGTVQRV